VAFLPYFFASVWPAARAGGSAWIADSFDPILAIPRTLWAFLPCGGYPAHLRGLSLLSSDTINTQPTWLITVTRALPVVIIGGAVLLLARPLTSRTRSEGAPDRPGHIFAGGLTLLPLVIAWLYSTLIRPNYLVGRYDLVAWPACMAWMGLGIAQASRLAAPKRSGWLTTLVGVVLVSCSLVPISRMAALHPPPTFHNVRAQRMAQLTSPGDLVIAFSYDRDYLQYYLHRAGFQADIASFPSWLERQVGWVDTEADLARERAGLLEQDAARLIERIGAVLARDGQVWILGDSIAPAGKGARGRINERLLGAIANTGYTLEVIDPELMIARLGG
jgi:hypothetical protein